MKKKIESDFLTHAPKNKEVTIQNNENYPNQKNYPGDSVEEHENLENANVIIAEGEIGQQRENL
jgi:hypothetical protein